MASGSLGVPVNAEDQNPTGEPHAQMVLACLAKVMSFKIRISSTEDPSPHQEGI